MCSSHVVSIYFLLFQDSYHRQAVNHHTTTNPDVSILDQAINCLSKGRDWMAAKDPADGLSVRYLIAIAKIRYGLVITAKYLHQLKCVDNRNEEYIVDINQVR